jgi:outer membrane protein
MNRIIFIITAFTYCFCSLYAQDTTEVLSLEEAVRIALEKSPFATRIRGDREIPETAVLQTISGVLPRFGVNSGYSQSGPQDTALGVLGEPVVVPNDQYSTSLVINQSIINPEQWFRIKQAFQIQKATEFSYTGSRADLAFNVKQTYFELLRLYKDLSVAEAALEQSEEQAQIARERFRLGALSRPELLRIEVGLAQRQVEQISSRSNVDNIQRNLANLLGMQVPIQIDTTLVFPDTTTPLPSADSLYALVPEQNPSYNTSRVSLNAKKTNKTAVVMNKIPSLSGSFTYGSFDTSFTSQFQNWEQNDFWELGVQLDWNIFEGTAWFARLREASIQIQTAEADMEIARNSVVEEMYQAWNNLQSTRDALVIARNLVDLAEEEFRLTTEKYRLGAASALDLLNSQVAYTEAQRQSTQIIINYYLALAQIQRLLGDW